MPLSLKNPKLLQDRAYIAGQWTPSKKNFDVLNPADGKKVGQVPDFGAKEAAEAIDAAEAALPEWSKKSAKERSVILRKWADLIVANASDLGALMTAEQGKPIAEAEGEV